MMMLKAIATSAAAKPIMNTTKICPTVGSGAVKRLKAIRLSEAAEKDLGAWRAAGLKFIERAKAAGWDEGDEIDDFVTGLLNATGWREAHVRNHGYVWKRVRRGAAEEGADD